MSVKKTTAEFIRDARKKFGDRFDYSMVNYQGAHTYVQIICAKHGIKEQTPDTHLQSKHGCRDCSIEARAASRVKYTTEEFRAALAAKYGPHLDFSLVEYANIKDYVYFDCRYHGAQRVVAEYLINDTTKFGCSDCYHDSRRLLADGLIRRFQNKFGKNKFSYEKVKLSPEKPSWHQPIEIICLKHNQTFFPKAADHFYKEAGCEACRVEKLSEAQRKTTREFIAQAIAVHGDRYLYSDTGYSGDQKYLTIGCRTHGPFSQRADHHLSGHGCDKCFNKGEGKIAEILLARGLKFKSLRIPFEKTFRQYDFFIEELGLIIERDGEQHYPNVWQRGSSHIFTSRGRSYKDQVENDALKLPLANERGYKVTRIPYWLSDEEVEDEIDLILSGNPSFPSLPCADQEETKPSPDHLRNQG